VTRTGWLMSDVRRGARRAPGSGHDVAGTGLDMDLPDAQIRSSAGLRCGDVAPDRGPVEKQAATGQLAGSGAVRAHKAGHSQRPGPAAGLASGLDPGRAGRHDHSEGHGCSKEYPEQGHHCIACHWLLFLDFARECLPLYRVVHVHALVVPEQPGTYVIHHNRSCFSCHAAGDEGEIRPCEENYCPKA
jgi:hypothetical protein